MIYFLPTMNGSGRFCMVNVSEPKIIPWIPTSPTALTNVQPNQATLVAISPATACALMLTHAYAGLWAPQFLEASGLLGAKREIASLGRKGGGEGVFWWWIFFVEKNEDVCFFWGRGERGMDIFFWNLFIWWLSLNSCPLKLGSKKDDIKRDSATIHSWLYSYPHFYLGSSAIWPVTRRQRNHLEDHPHL